MTEDEELKAFAESYALIRDFRIVQGLGRGIQGSVWMVNGKEGFHPWVLKIHRREPAYLRERACYHRLRETGTTEICGLNIPVLLRTDDEWRAIEMTLVARPFLLDFGTAWVDERPEFPPETWTSAEAAAAEKFGPDWPAVEEAVRRLETETGVIMGDLHPGNVSLR